jgi:hypothetical protein
MAIKVTYRERKLLKKQKEKEKEKLKKQKEKEKKKLENYKKRLKKKREKYKPIHLKNLEKKHNAKAYQKRRKKVLEEKKKNGDVQGYYRIILTKNYTQTKELSPSRWLLTAYKKFNDYIKENNDNIICEKICTKTQNNITPVKYEILLLKKINPETDNGIRELKNDIGLFVENKISNNNQYAIIAKNDWFIPETYNVYGYNPQTDKKTGKWILDNILLKNCNKDNLKNVFIFNEKLIIQYNLDFDFITCKSKEECIRLYNHLEYSCSKLTKYIVFTGFLSDNRKKWMNDKIKEKTGW